MPDLEPEMSGRADPTFNIEKAKQEFTKNEISVTELENVVEFWDGHVANCDFCKPDQLCSIHYEWWVTGCWPDLRPGRR